MVPSMDVRREYWEKALVQNWTMVMEINKSTPVLKMNEFNMVSLHLMGNTEINGKLLAT